MQIGGNMNKELSLLSEEAAQGQLDGYNNRDIEEFLKWYSEDVKIYDLDTGELKYGSKEAMRPRYAKLFENEYLECTLVNRMVLNRTVIDQESVQVDDTEKRSEVIAIYDVGENGLIEAVRFTRGKA